ncbi:MAG: ferric reductase-like transmembrane domain-containing protein [Gammaproteobacteria bacterium]|nr:ferric reductase-like transmembrane domain-containing protein [Gammaproteobacteria bacterium]MDH4253220.1 ferric reductase-like transmembrane domain-containing protein [Gammaproteobacteria bacterium]MDH5309001.1 ferric reductase-like transmembrane domain-containing protein [Gammaproteobacteria bacterium]
MKGLLLTLGAVALLSFLAAPTLGAGLLWDAGNGLGLVALGGLLHLVASSGPGINLRAHQVFGYAVLAIAATHAFWFLLLDPVAITYLQPGAPLYMWLGCAGFVLLIGMMIVGMPQYRLRLHRRYANFRYWHRLLAIATIAAALWHVLGSGLYFGTWYQALLLLATAGLVCVGDRAWLRSAAIGQKTTAVFVGVGLVLTLSFAALRNLP